ncbi:MAG: hypothetical protein UX13_C0001G0005 [Candidatus Woesebacteria bacterium GW2011_GWB1_45_5]|uniref:ArnT-like N-terminal domain-containing protein n=1 Tax=Candidatus Woesebacteria bacterium GW2011_GWB1_45_5 TaxID=1618581 RepID=A0A0G1MRU1_9BACT|nr:MAG: hypothetical protein UX13_C0001G0005 [Candidatus Woesebacteria bacterium GW2011_GWB1_45_5]
MRQKFILFLVPAVFFLVSIFTLKDYGISWDSPIHFRRGQSYLHYLTTGKMDYKDVSGKMSYFQSNIQNASYFLQDDGGHPPVNGILSAVTNYVFFRQLNILGDIEAYNLFIVITSSLLVLIVGLFAFGEYGIFAALSSQTILALYPLFFAESHFNIKDPPLAFFFGLTIYLIWLAIKRNKWWLMIAAGLSSGIALGIKFNILFLPFIIVPYLFLEKRFFKNAKLVIAFLVIPVISFLILFALWPYLWAGPGRLLSVFDYYKNIGTGTGYQNNFLLPGGLNAFALFWITITTPPVVLLLVLTGVLAIMRDRAKQKTGVLWLLWMIVPIVRISLPNTTVYGGIRQIMEFVPAMALIAGVGASRIVSGIKFPKAVFYVLILTVLSVPVVKLHPNQNVYFNSLIGGLHGAYTKNVPYWGNSFGNAYWQAVKWLNENSESGARLALIQGTMTNIPPVQLRSDIDFSNLNWSGIFRSGEYLLELTHNDPVKLYPYGWEYVENFLDPVYEVKVDGVAIAKLWKNDLEHTKTEFRKEEIKTTHIPLKDGRELRVDLGEEKIITRVYVGFTETGKCSGLRRQVVGG